MKKYSVIVPVFNRPNEVDELLESLARQTYTNFEIVLVEDGSTETSEHIVRRYADRLDIRYFFKKNTGPGDSRNFGMERAQGDYMVFFDSDCLIPDDYFAEVERFLAVHPLDTYGGPDNAHSSFTIVQKAINYAMTSFITTGGVRGKQNNLDTYQPRSFNMGFTRKVYETVGGFGDIHPGEDPDLSYRIMDAGFRVGLIPDAYVYHKRRIDFSKFLKQVYKFGVVRIILMKWHPGRSKIVYTLPSLFLLGTIALIVLSVAWTPLFLLPLAFLVAVIFIEAMVKTGSLVISGWAIVATFLQLFGYGYGFLKSFVNVKLLGRDERKAFPGFFFRQKISDGRAA